MAFYPADLLAYGGRRLVQPSGGLSDRAEAGDSENVMERREQGCIHTTKYN